MMSDTIVKITADLMSLKSEAEELKTMMSDIKTLKSKTMIDCAEKAFADKVSRIISSIDDVSKAVSTISDAKIVSAKDEFKYKYIDYIDSLTDSIIPHALLPLDASASEQNVMHIKKIIREYDKTNKVISEDPALASACPNYNIIFSKIYEKINSKLHSMPVVPETKIDKSPEYPEYTNPCNIDEFRDMIDKTASIKESEKTDKTTVNETCVEKPVKNKASKKQKSATAKKQVRHLRKSKLNDMHSFGLS